MVIKKLTKHTHFMLSLTSINYMIAVNPHLAIYSICHFGGVVVCLTINMVYASLLNRFEVKYSAAKEKVIAIIKVGLSNLSLSFTKVTVTEACISSEITRKSE